MVGIRDKLKVEIVEHNNEVRKDVFRQRTLFIWRVFFCKVLPILIRDIGNNLKEGEDVALVRFDSYADLLTPKKVKADEIQTLDHLVE